MYVTHRPMVKHSCTRHGMSMLKNKTKNDEVHSILGTGRDYKGFR